MTRRQRGSKRKQAATARRERPRPGTRARTPGPIAIVTAAAVLAVGAWAVTRLVRRPAPPPQTHEQIAAAMDPRQALDRGVALGREKRHQESLPYFRRAAETSSRWLEHWDYAAALNNSAFEVWSRHGIVGPASRSTVERLEGVSAALGEVRVAERLAPDARTRSVLEVVRARTFELWGFPVDALEAYRAGRAADSSYAAARDGEAKCLASLRQAAKP